MDKKRAGQTTTFPPHRGRGQQNMHQAGTCEYQTKQGGCVLYETRMRSREQRVNGFDGTDWPRLEVLYKKKSASTLLHRERAKSGFKRTIVSYGEQNGRKENPPFPKKNLVPPGVEYSLHLVCNAFEIAGGPQKNTPTSESECFSVRDENTRSQLGRPK